VVENQIARDLEDPRTVPRRIRIRDASARHAQEDFLRQILRRIRAADDAAQIAKDPLTMQGE
jgi:hypothetical protein